MPNSYFAFKQFQVDFCSDVFRLGTDACFLGAYAKAEHPKRILDIGTGTGVIALMLAQRFPEAQIVALDASEAAADCAKQNFLRSPFAARLQSIHTNLQELEPSENFDLIVSNPPFFQNSFPAPEPSRHLARHNDELSDDDLLTGVKAFLTDAGSFWVILPFDRKANFLTAAKKHGFFLCEQVSLHDKPTRPPKRVVLELRKQDSVVTTATLWWLKTASGEYNDTTKQLWQDFYLNL
ncbi:MAG: methyltransferase [Bacteroidota bacterium]